jgi:hypothetical protein
MGTTTGATGATTSGKAGARSPGRRLPEDVSGVLLVGIFDFGGVSTRNAKQYVVDIETTSTEGRKVIESATGWMADQDGGATPLGRKVMAGDYLTLLDQPVAVVCSYNVGVSGKGVGRLYLTVEDIIALDDIA